MVYAVIISTGQRIKQRRIDAGYSVMRLAQLMHIHRSAIYRWEDGYVLPSLDNLLTLADIFGCTLEDLIVTERSD